MCDMVQFPVSCVMCVGVCVCMVCVHVCVCVCGCVWVYTMYINELL